MTNRQFLGGLCIRNHRYKNTNKSLRRISQGDCIECIRIKRKKNRTPRKLVSQEHTLKVRKEGNYRYRKNQVKELSDFYVLCAIYKDGILPKGGYCDKKYIKIIELKRIYMKIRRLIKEKRKCQKEKRRK